MVLLSDAAKRPKTDIKLERCPLSRKARGCEFARLLGYGVSLKPPGLNIRDRRPLCGGRFVECRRNSLSLGLVSLDREHGAKQRATAGWQCSIGRG